MNGSADTPTHDDVIATVEAWRARGGARSHPVAFCIVEALSRRAAAQRGEARRVMLRRVEQLMAGHLAEPAAMTGGVPAAAAAGRSEPRRAALAGLSDLVDRLGRAPLQAAARPPFDVTQAASTGPRSPKLESMNAVTAFKGTWSRLRADQRLRQALSQVPAMAGPLNSSHVVNRTLQTMRELSPEYLEAFMAQVDTLMWLERASGGALPPRAAAPPGSRRASRTAG